MLHLLMKLLNYIFFGLLYPSFEVLIVMSHVSKLKSNQHKQNKFIIKIVLMKYSVHSGLIQSGDALTCRTHLSLWAEKEQVGNHKIRAMITDAHI